MWKISLRNIWFNRLKLSYEFTLDILERHSHSWNYFTSFFFANEIYYVKIEFQSCLKICLLAPLRLKHIIYQLDCHRCVPNKIIQGLLSSHCYQSFFLIVIRKHRTFVNLTCLWIILSSIVGWNTGFEPPPSVWNTRALPFGHSVPADCWTPLAVDRGAIFQSCVPRKEGLSKKIPPQDATATRLNFWVLCRRDAGSVIKNQPLQFLLLLEKRGL